MGGERFSSDWCFCFVVHFCKSAPDQHDDNKGDQYGSDLDGVSFFGFNRIYLQLISMTSFVIVIIGAIA